MKLREYERTLTNPLPKTTLAFLIKENQILLAMKKRDFGKSKWNGVGGKQQNGETIKQTALREMDEEIGVITKTLSQVALFSFYYPFTPQDNQTVYVFTAKTWLGEPRETEEMRPAWFSFNNIPYDLMWSDDRIWLPEVLKGNLIRAAFMFNADNQIEGHSLKIVSKF